MNMREATAFFRALHRVLPPQDLPAALLQRYEEARQATDAASERWLRLREDEIQSQEHWIREILKRN